jgi:hypothetical protein
MKIFGLILFNLTITIAGQSEVHTFTDTMGRTIKAEVLKIENENITILREDGLKFTINTQKLSKKDQEFIESQNKTTTTTNEIKTPEIITKITAELNKIKSFSTAERLLNTIPNINTQKEDCNITLFDTSEDVAKNNATNKGTEIIKQAIENNKAIIIPQNNGKFFTILYLAEKEIKSTTNKSGVWETFNGIDIQLKLWPTEIKIDNWELPILKINTKKPSNLANY